MSALLERIGVELPVVQAGMAGGLARHELASAVSEAGGLGTIGTMRAAALERELEAARGRTRRPVAVNLLLPFARRDHWEVAGRADAVVTFWGRPRRRTARPWLHQCGSVEEARAAHAAGADGVIAQGVEAGGHVRGTTPALRLLELVRAAVPEGFPVLVAGGIAEPADVGAALEAGADAVVVGTRYVLTEESRAHPGYRDRLMDADETLLTELFGMGWAAPHRVVPNEATRRWLGRDSRGPSAVRAVNRLLAPALRRLPEVDPLRFQRTGRPFFTPNLPTDDRPAELVEVGALYAGETVARLRDVRPAGPLTRELAAA